MESCPECGDQVWGFVQPAIASVQPAQPVAVPSWQVMVFPCEHLVWLPIDQPKAS
jgi:hypothetical protein